MDSGHNAKSRTRRRYLTQRERNLLYWSQEGKCAMCNQPLGEDWHAHHTEPHAETHRTNVHMKLKLKRTDAPPTRREAAQRSPIFLKERGSIDWCYQKVAYLKDVFEMEQRTVDDFEDALNDLKQYRAWEKIPESHPYGSLEALLKAEIGIESEQIGIQTIQQRISRAAANTTGEANPHGGDRKSRCTVHLETVSERAERNGIGRRTQIKLDRLARQAPDVHQLVVEGKLKVAAAERAAGLAKKKTPLDNLRQWWRKASDDERQAFLSEIAETNGQENVP